jgi:hypothetical protein
MSLPARAALAVCLAAAACTGEAGPGDALSTPERMALTVNASFDHASGSYSVVDLDTLGAVPDILAVSPDAVAACSDQGIFVVQRLGWDSMVLVDDEAPFGIRAEHSLGTGSNPQGLIGLPGGDLLATLLGRDFLLAVDPSTGEETGRVDLSWAADGDGLPEASLVARAGDLVAVALQRLDRTTPLWDPSGPGWLVVVDPDGLGIVDADPSTGEPDGIVLTGANPSPYGRMAWNGSRLLVPLTGLYGELDGGIESVDLELFRAEGYIVTEEELGGDLTDFVIAGEHLAYATVSSPEGTDLLVRFDPVAGRAEDEPVLVGRPFTLLQVQITSRGELLVVNRDLEESGLDVLDAATGAFVTRVAVGMAPFSVCVP